MNERKEASDELVDSAYEHIIGEIGLDQLRESLHVNPSRLQKAHDSIHEFMLLARLCAPPEEKGVPWPRHSTFLLYQWEAFNHAHRSFIEALCANYTISSALLRITLELLIKGAFLECLAHPKYLENADILVKKRAGFQLVQLIQKSIRKKPTLKVALERNSANILDILDQVGDHSRYRPSISLVIRQLTKWELFYSINKPLRVIYEDLYSDLSGDVHSIPSKIDIGKRIVQSTPDVFEQKVSAEDLEEYLDTLHRIIDVCIVLELNLFTEIIKTHESVKEQLRKRIPVLQELELVESLKRLEMLVI